ncbi:MULTISPECIES: response regulator transcription factor [Bacillaceae]|jgi:two-component system, OmpR family, response regulator CiaR|uniref:Response regulator transcription factor n=3 Tax=Peribacillus TaxID=2675229 RepID=A0AAJ1QTM8_9BACI|nr:MULTISPECIES: response regulator transcription factor [Bacillaceae]KOR81203.1 response regulator [Bacillus sp. FJAT-21352]KOR85114.1 response regulator [Bacillus sp. FJAT-22058]MBD8137965.1 response regulator transcription factor [Bacillus sp. CFBP 13597]MBL3643052.1 response regulator transcription factor [Bacillus sp. RHFB]MCD1160736.1 response regulator transcription factor [Peribacillus castrilensis]PEF37462.1 DNA-binding response regulator [Bacillus sp. AFS094228]PEO49935.1 DNA-bindi
MKVLVVEDNVSLLESIRQILTDEYEVDTADNGEDGLFMAQQSIYDIIILDVMLPGIDGFEIVRKIREAKIDTSVLFLTAKDALEDRVRGLEMGGDDYLVKPFQAPELKARIRALLRRSGIISLEQHVKYRNIELLEKEKDILVDGKVIKMTLKQFELLEYLIQNNGKILTREQIFDRIWGFDSDTTIAIVEVFIHHLRKKLEPFNYHKDIQTVRGIGYMLKQP